MPEERLARILERCRGEDHPELGKRMVADAAAIQTRNQFSDDRESAKREMRELLKAEVTRRIVEPEAGR
jgi:hypothetical protein